MGTSGNFDAGITARTYHLRPLLPPSHCTLSHNALPQPSFQILQLLCITSYTVPTSYTGIPHHTVRGPTAIRHLSDIFAVTNFLGGGHVGTYVNLGICYCKGGEVSIQMLGWRSIYYQQTVCADAWSGCMV